MFVMIKNVRSKKVCLDICELEILLFIYYLFNNIIYIILLLYIHIIRMNIYVFSAIKNKTKNAYNLLLLYCIRDYCNLKG